MKAPDTSPFHFKGGKDCFLLIHGFTGTPYEMRHLGEGLANAGYSARGICLPGHDGDPVKMRSVKWTEWVNAAFDEFRKLRKEHDRVFVGGLSMGALLCIMVASEFGDDVAGAAIMATPLKLNLGPVRLLLPLVKYTPLSRIVRIKKGDETGICDPEAKAVHPSYPFFEATAFLELLELKKAASGRLGKIVAPCIALHGRNDEAVPVKCMNMLLRRISSERRRGVVMERSGHVITVDYDKDRVIEEVVNFFK
jgi:carboxylesterase